MQNVVVDKPYRFVPPYHGRLWPRLIRYYLPRHIKKAFGVTSVRFHGVEQIRASLDAGNGVLLTPNHCRPSDPFVLGLLANEAGHPPYIMASWHLFAAGGFQGWILPRLRVFSVYREGLDSAAVKEAVSILSESKGPLVIFPEGIITRTNDRLATLIEGTAFIASTAAKARAKAQAKGSVVVHPISMRYFFNGDLDSAIKPVLVEIERRLSWSPQSGETISRIRRIGEALLALKEFEYLNNFQSGSIAERQAGLINGILKPLEAEWKVKKPESDIPGRVRALRTAILPEIIGGEITDDERARRGKQLESLYLVQQLSLYPPDYIASKQTAERILETVERFEEDLTDAVRVYSPISCEVAVGEGISVGADRSDRGSLMEKIRIALEAGLTQLESYRSGGAHAE